MTHRMVPRVGWGWIGTKLGGRGRQGSANRTRLIWHRRWVDAHGWIGISGIHAKVHSIQGISNHRPAVMVAIATVVTRLLRGSRTALRTVDVMTAGAKASLVVVEVIDKATVTNGTGISRAGENAVLRHGLRMHHCSGRHALTGERHSGVEWTSSSRLGPDVDGLVELLLLTRRGRQQRTSGRPMVLRQVVGGMVVEVGRRVEVGIIGEVVEIMTGIARIGSSKGGSLALRSHIGRRVVIIIDRPTSADANVVDTNAHCLIECMAHDTVLIQLFLLQLKLLSGCF